MASLDSIIASEDALVKEAALALPHAFDKCTYDLGPIRQAVHLCLTCGMSRGLCSACSVACHGDHEQIELFPKRNFMCDCPSKVNGVTCVLYKGVSPAPPSATSNAYGQNFHAKFCRCQRPYDAKKERETMVQCLGCEDWFHESCLNLRTRPNERQLTPALTCPVEERDGEDAESLVSSDLPMALLPSSSYDTFICGPCVLSNETLRRWAGTKGIMMVFRENYVPSLEPDNIEEGGVDPSWKILDGDDDDSEVGLSNETAKRIQSDINIDNNDRPVKKLKAENGSSVVLSSGQISNVLCLAPPINTKAQRILTQIASKVDNIEKKPNDQLYGQGDIFLTDGWRERWCRCPQCLAPLERQNYLLVEEDTYEPPEDPDSDKSLVDLGMRALLNLPRDRAIDGIEAYNKMRDELISYLRPFAQEGRVVREEDVREFFEAKAQETKS